MIKDRRPLREDDCTAVIENMRAMKFREASQQDFTKWGFFVNIEGRWWEGKSKKLYWDMVESNSNDLRENDLKREV